VVRPKEIQAGRSEDLATVGREPPFREDLNTEAGEYPMLEAVIRKHLVKTLKAGKD
jgi:hypothetical protein